MAITQVGTATSATSAGGTNVSPAKPTGVASGDILIAFGCTTETTPFFDTIPSGFNAFESSVTTDTPGLFQGRAWWKLAGGSEPSTYTFGSSGASGAGAPLVVTISAWRGVHNTTPIDDSATVGASSSTEPANPTISITQTTGRAIFCRMARVNSSSIPTFSTATAGWSELSGSEDGAFSGGSVSYGMAQYAMTSDTSGAQTEPAVTCSATETDNVYMLVGLKVAAVPATGDIGMTLGNVTATGAGEVHDDATMSMTLSSVTEAFAADHFPPAVCDIGMTLSPITEAFAGDSTGGAFDMTLQPVTMALDAQIVGGSFSMTLNPVTEAFAGAVNPIGTFSLTLNPITMEFITETVPFGEHVIHVEPEARAFLVIDDDPGLKDIKRSQVTDL